MQDGTERDVDVVVCATGYAAADYLGQIEVTGEGGVTLREVSAPTGRTPIWGWQCPAFPILFMLYGPNTNVGSNSVIFVLEAQACCVVRALRYLRRRRRTYVAVKPAAMASFLAKVDQWIAGHGVDYPVQQLLPCRQRTRRHAVAAQRPRILGDDAAVQGRRLHLRTGAGGPTGHARWATAMTEFDGLDGWEQLRSRTGGGATARTNFSLRAVKLMREPFNDRRHEAATLVDVSGLQIADHTARGPSRRACRCV